MTKEELVFNSELINKKIGGLSFSSPVYTIGIDTVNKKQMSYCLCKISGESMEILLAKTISKEAEFKRQVKNLSKYFNADIIEEEN